MKLVHQRKIFNLDLRILLYCFLSWNPDPKTFLRLGWVSFHY